MHHEQKLFRVVRYVQVCAVLTLLLILGLVILMINPDLIETDSSGSVQAKNSIPGVNISWKAPDSTAIPQTPEGDLIRYGRELVAHTAVFLGPKGKIKPLSNGLNCQNCHLKAGKKIFGNNYSAVAATYPKFRSRSGSIETVEKRVNDCIERSLNGKRLDDDSREMRAFVAYILWVGKDVQKGVAPEGSGLVALPLLDRAANPVAGKTIFQKNCVDCHGPDGLGIRHENGVEWKYPPLWGEHSYNAGAGLLRLSKFAGYVKANMPNGATFDNPILTDEEAWDVAAYINSLPRPVKEFPSDWPDISKKPFDHPFGPYADTFSESQHKFGPFAEMKRSPPKK